MVGAVARRGAGATILLSVPLHPNHWTAFDDFVGHERRYTPDRLRANLAEQGFVVRQSAVYGMQPRSSLLLDFAMWWLVHRRRQAMWWYNRIFMPLALRFEARLAPGTGLIDLESADEVLLVCRKGEARVG